MNNSVYLSDMSESLLDKLFFLEYIPEEDLDVIVDFGCADGTLTRAIANAYPKACVIGCESNKDFLKLAKEQPRQNLFYCSSWKEVEDLLSTFVDITKKALILSSVIHEVHSYDDPDFFWEQIVKLPNWDYIAVRDMGLSNSQANKPVDVATALYFCDWIEDNPINDMQVKSFRSHWGRISTNKALCHFLLKYRYKVNWEREVKENYLPLTIEEVLENMRPYHPIYFRHWTLPFIEDCVKKDFGFSMPCDTNYKAVFAK